MHISPGDTLSYFVYPLSPVNKIITNTDVVTKKPGTSTPFSFCSIHTRPWSHKDNGYLRYYVFTKVPSVLIIENSFFLLSRVAGEDGTEVHGDLESSTLGASPFDEG